MKKVTISILFILFVLKITAQKNAIYGTVGLLYSSISYERRLTTSLKEFKKNKYRFKTSFKLHGGKGRRFYFLSEDYYKYTHLGAKLTLLDGKLLAKKIEGDKSYLELGFGAGFVWAETNTELDTRTMYGNLNIGYRIEYDDVLFRVGIGYPEVMYLSFGVRF